MSKNKMKIFTLLLVVGFIALLPCISIAEKNISIVGIVNENGQLIVENDIVYEIADTEKGAELVALITEKVAVEGTVIDADGTKILSVTSFEIVEE